MIAWLNWSFNAALCVLTFVALSFGVPAHIESEWSGKPKPDVEQVAEDLERPPISDEAWAKVDQAYWP